MEFPKQMKDIVYGLLQEPTLDKFREFIKNHTGEHNSIDFKKQWIEGNQLAKEMLAIANSGGGVIIFGVTEKEDGSIDVNGLQELKDPADVSNEIKNFLSSDLKYELYPFSFTTSEYKELEGHHYQMMVIEDRPEFIPFMAKKESSSLKPNIIYIRRGTSCEAANQEEIQDIIRRRINYAHPLNGEPLDLETHLDQLKELYRHIEKEKVHYTFGLSAQFKTFSSIWGEESSREPNPFYPDEEFEEFISRLIAAKKNKIERVLDLY
jgi:predicted HTH transcriptional regulator